MIETGSFQGTLYQIQHRYLDQGALFEHERGWHFSNYDNLAFPATQAGHGWHYPLGTGALTLEDGQRGLKAVQDFHAQHPASEYEVHDPKAWYRCHRPTEFRLVRAHYVRKIEAVEISVAAEIPEH